MNKEKKLVEYNKCKKEELKHLNDQITKRDALSELAFSSHHRNHSLWVLTQKYNSVSKDVREQIKWLCLFFTKDRDSFEDCLRENDVIPY